MIPAPYLRGINEQGGTLYVFPSVSRDLTKTLVSNDYEFKFSHFACLNLPEILEGKFTEGSDKGLYVSTLIPDNYSIETNTPNGLGKAIVANLQNYVMNFEAAILNGEGDDDDYDNDILTTVSEKVFFNWLQKVGAIKFEESGNLESFNSYSDRTVQYIGNLDVMNTVEVNGDSFEELYIHIPSTAGASTSVYFRTGEMTDNKNYLNKNYVVSNGNHENCLVGRNPDDGGNPYASGSGNSPAGPVATPFYDSDFGANVYAGDIGHTIDFRDSSYAGGDGISTMNSMSLESFEFNVVLIYYDLLQKTSNAGVKRLSTNLYGILFLDNVKEENGVSFIQRYPKVKETIYGNGNGYALKIDIKVDTIGDRDYNWNTISVDGTNTAESMTLYEKALTQLQNCIDFFYAQKRELVKLSDRVSTLENLVMGIDSVSSLKDDIKRLYDMCDGNAIVDTAALLGLIDANTKKLDNIMNGGKDLKLQYDTDVLQPGPGIGMVKSLNKVVISSEQKYSINTVLDGNESEQEVEIDEDNPLSTASELKNCKIGLLAGENFAVISMRDEGNSTTNLTINVDTKDYSWTEGQSLKIYLDYPEGGTLNFDNSMSTGVVIKPTVNTTLTIPGYEVEGNNLIEVICINENKFIYVIK